MSYFSPKGLGLLSAGTQFKISSDFRNFEKDLTFLIGTTRVYADEVFQDAMKGDLDAIGRLSAIYFNGYGIDVDRDFAITVLEEVTSNPDHDLLKHKYALARYYERSDDYAKATPIYSELISKGFGMAMTQMGKLYLDGLGFNQNREMGERLMRQGSNTGNVTSRGSYAMYLISEKSVLKKLKGILLFLRNVVPVIMFIRSREYDGLV